MKIAVASSDGTHISGHFGRSSCFLVFEVADGKIVVRQVRSNSFTAHAKGECSAEHQHEHQTHSHASVVKALDDCQALLCHGMGWRAAEALGQQGIQPFVLSEDCTPEQAVALFLEGKLSSASQTFCGGHS